MGESFFSIKVVGHQPDPAGISTPSDAAEVPWAVDFLGHSPSPNGRFCCRFGDILFWLEKIPARCNGSSFASPVPRSAMLGRAGPKVREPARPPKPGMLLGQQSISLPASCRAVTDSSNARGAS